MPVTTGLMVVVRGVEGGVTFPFEFPARRLLGLLPRLDIFWYKVCSSERQIEKTSFLEKRNSFC